MKPYSTGSESKNHSYQEIYELLDKQSRPNIDYYVLMAMASIIATFGLLLNSSAIIIGAMVVSPLMDPIMGISFASLIRNRRFTLRSTVTLVSGILLAIAISFVIAIFFGTVGTTGEILARTKPNIMDLFVALSAGFLGAFVKVRKTISGTVYGVAIAISLAPPLCVIGIGLAYFNKSIYLGALLLFLTNLVSMMLSSLLGFLIIDIPHNRMSLRSLFIPVILVIGLSIPLFLSFMTLTEEKRLTRELRAILESKTHTFENVQISNTEIDLFQKPIRLTVTVRTTADSITPKQIRLVEEYLERKIGSDIDLTVNVTPVLEIKSG